MTTYAVLRGGPHSGKVVEFVGIYHCRKVIAKRGQYRLLIEARYIWALEGDKFFGDFAGFYRDNIRVRRDGSRYPRKARSK